MLYYCCSTAFEKYEILNEIYIIKKKKKTTKKRTETLEICYIINVGMWPEEVW